MSAYRTPARIEPEIPRMIPVHAWSPTCPRCDSFMQARLYAQEGRYSYFVCDRPCDYLIAVGCKYEWATDTRWTSPDPTPPDGGVVAIKSKL